MTLEALIASIPGLALTMLLELPPEPPRQEREPAIVVRTVKTVTVPPAYPGRRP